MNHRGEPMREGWFFEDQSKVKCSTEHCQVFGKYIHGAGGRRWCKGCAKNWGAFYTPARPVGGAGGAT